jgi:hypothetical protein
MTDTFTFFTPYKTALANGAGSDLDAGAIKVALVGASYTPDQDAHDFFNDITNELSASGDYTAGGVALQSPALSVVSHNVKFAAANLALAGVTTSADIKYLVIYRDTGTAATSPLIGYITLATALGGTNITINIVMNASGVLTIS